MCRRFIARHQEQGNCAQHLVFAELLAALFGGDEAADQVVAWLLTAVGDHAADVLDQLLVASPRLVQRAVIAAQSRHHRVRPALEPLPVFARYAEHLRDHDNGQRPGQFGDEVKLGAAGEPVQQLVDDLLD